MKLILTRHGEAENVSATGLDTDRNLTAKGKQDIQRMAEYLRSGLLKPSRIYHSPLARTSQTATIIGEVLGITPLPAEELTPHSDYSLICTQLKCYTNSETVVLVGHNPDISIFASSLIGGTKDIQNFIFNPGTMVAINVAREKFQYGQVIFSHSPEYLP